MRLRDLHNWIYLFLKVGFGMLQSTNYKLNFSNVYSFMNSLNVNYINNFFDYNPDQKWATVSKTISNCS